MDFLQLISYDRLESYANDADILVYVCLCQLDNYKKCRQFAIIFFDG